MVVEGNFDRSLWCQSYSVLSAVIVDSRTYTADETVQNIIHTHEKVYINLWTSE